MYTQRETCIEAEYSNTQENAFNSSPEKKKLFRNSVLCFDDQLISFRVFFPLSLSPCVPVM